MERLTMASSVRITLAALAIMVTACGCTGETTTTDHATPRQVGANVPEKVAVEVDPKGFLQGNFKIDGRTYSGPADDRGRPVPVPLKPGSYRGTVELDDQASRSWRFRNT